MPKRNPDIPKGTYPGYYHYGIYGATRVGWAHQRRGFIEFAPIRPLTKDRSEAKRAAQGIADNWGASVGLFSVDNDLNSRLVEVMKPAYKQKAKAKVSAKKAVAKAAAGQKTLFNGRATKRNVADRFQFAPKHENRFLYGVEEKIRGGVWRVLDLRDVSPLTTDKAEAMRAALAWANKENSPVHVYWSNDAAKLFPVGIVKPEAWGKRGGLFAKNPKRTLRNSGIDEAAAASEGFHGRPVQEYKSLDQPIKFHSKLAELGELVRLEVKSINGFVVWLEGFDGALLCMSPDRSQLYIVGGDQSVDVEAFGIDPKSAHDSEVLGRVRNIVYFTTKEHLGDQGGEANYKHKFGEEGGETPHLVYDTLNNTLFFAGGSYTIPDEGIRN